MDNMRRQAENLGAVIIDETAVKVDLSQKPFTVTLDSDDIYTCDALIIATGASAKWLDLPNEQPLRGFGVSACATCDGFFTEIKKSPLSAAEIRRWKKRYIWPIWLLKFI